MPGRLALVVAAAALLGCPPRAPPPDLSLDPEELLAQVRAAQARVRSVRGEARVRVESPDGSGAIVALLAAEKPDRLYVQTLDFFGNTAAVLAASGPTLTLYDARERVLYRGAATAENLSRLVPVPLSPADLARILCGSAPLLGEPVRAEPGRGFVTLELSAGDRTQSLRIGAGAAVRRATVRVRGDGPGGYELEFEGVERGRFPDAAALVTEGPRVRLRLSWNEVEPNAPLDDGLFSPPPPRGARVVDLEEAPPPPELFPGDPARGD